MELSADNEYYTVVDSVVFDKTNATLLIYPAGKKKTSYTVPDGVTAIGSYAFGDCPFLENIILPDSLLFIEPEAFYKLDTLTSITLPENLQTIGDDAFEDCSSLASISLPEGLQTIGDEAFARCDSLRSITLPQGIVSIGANPFAACEQLVSIQLSPGNETYAVIDNVLFDTKRHALITYPYAKPDTSYTVPQDIISIGEGAFYDNPSLTHLVLPETLLYIDHNAIHSCESLTSLTLPEGLLFLGWENFFFCDKLILTVHEGTYAQEYAEDYEIDYELAPTDTSRYSTETVVEVSDAVSLLAAIQPNTTIHLLPGDYNLNADAVKKLLAEGNGALSPYVSYEPDFDYYSGLVISDVENLTIIAEDQQELYTTNIDETVLIFNNCRNINILRLSMGHRPEKATACTASVIAIVNCEAFSFYDCELYGCGYMGAYIENASHVVFFMCEIRDCSDSAVYMTNATNILFDEAFITGNGTKSRYAYQLFWMDEGASHVTFQYCSIDDNGNTNTYSTSTALFRIKGERDTLTIRNCSFENNLYDEQIQIIH